MATLSIMVGKGISEIPTSLLKAFYDFCRHYCPAERVSSCLSSGLLQRLPPSHTAAPGGYLFPTPIQKPIAPHPASTKWLAGRALLWAVERDISCWGSRGLLISNRSSRSAEVNKLTRRTGNMEDNCIVNFQYCFPVLEAVSLQIPVARNHKWRGRECAFILRSFLQDSWKHLVGCWINGAFDLILQTNS